LKRDKKPLGHGEAVAIGMICEAYLSKTQLDFSNKDLRDIAEFISRYFTKYSLRSILSPELINLMRQDKKNEHADAINFTLLKKIGKGSINHVCTESQIAAALNYYDSL
jgi:3-dehydroquinate synthase